MNALKINNPNLILLETPTQSHLVEVDLKEERKANRRIWRQVMKFVIACMQSQRSDLNFTDWHRLEYRNEYHQPDRRSHRG